jgi:hypothetical protein
MSKTWKIIGIAAVVAILGVAALGAVAFAQDDSGSSSTPFNFAERFREAIAGVLGIPVDEYDSAVSQAQGQVVDDAVSEGWLTQDQADLLRWRMEQEPGLGMPGTMGKGSFGTERGMLRGGEDVLSVAADTLDMSLTDLLTELQGGKSITDVAGEKGIDTKAIVDAYVAGLQEDMNEAVTEGRMTQKQADYYLEQATTRVADQLQVTGLGVGGHPGRFPGRDLPGGMQGAPAVPEGSDA